MARFRQGLSLAGLLGDGTQRHREGNQQGTAQGGINPRIIANIAGRGAPRGTSTPLVDGSTCTRSRAASSRAQRVSRRRHHA